MRTILCPIDFSETSIKALLYAYDIALATGASLSLLHTYHIPRVVQLMKAYPQPDLEAHITYEREALEKMDNLISWLNKIYAPAAVKSFYKTVSSFAVDEIIKTAYEQYVDLIVLGTKNTKDLKSIFFGTNTVRVIEETHLPVLVVPALATYTTISHMLYISHQSHKQEIQFANNFAKVFNASVTLVHMQEKNLAASHQSQAIAAGTLPAKAQQLYGDVISSGKSIQQTISDFTNEHASSMLAISASRRQLLDEVISEKNPCPLHMPVLILP